MNCGKQLLTIWKIELLFKKIIIYNDGSYIQAFDFDVNKNSVVISLINFNNLLPGQCPYFTVSVISFKVFPTYSIQIAH